MSSDERGRSRVRVATKPSPPRTVRLRGAGRPRYDCRRGPGGGATAPRPRRPATRPPGEPARSRKPIPRDRRYRSRNAARAPHSKIEIDRHGSGFVATDHGLGPLSPVVGQDAHMTSGRNAQGGQVVGEPVGPFVELSIGQPTLTGDKGGRSGTVSTTTSNRSARLNCRVLISCLLCTAWMPP